MPPLDAANAAQGLHHRPAQHAVDLAVVQRAGIHLGIVQTENAAEGPLQFVAHHRQLVGSGGAQPVEQNDGVGDGRIGLNVVQPHHDAVVLAACGVGSAGAEDGVDHRAVGVIDHAERVAQWPRALHRRAG